MNIKKEWDFSLIYKSIDDPKIEKDLKKSERAHVSFAKKYYNNDSYLKSAHKLAEACKDYENLISNEGSIKPYVYFSLQNIVDSGDDKIKAFLTKIDNRLTEFANKTVFFRVSLSQIPKAKQTEFLKHSKLKAYRYFLKKIFDNSKYYLSEKEEKILGLVSQTSRDMWIDSFRKLLSEQVIDFDGKKYPINEAIGLLSQLPTKPRRELDKNISKKLKEISFVAEAEINAVYNFKKVRNDLRGHKKPYSATINGNQDDEKVIENLVDLVTRYFRVSHRFYKAKAKLLKVKTLKYADRVAPVGTTTKQYSFSESIEILKNAFSKIDNYYVKTLESYLEKGQIDVFPKKGKQGGAFCWANQTLPVFVMLNHTDSLTSVTTFAHEMGHAFHSELSKSQPNIYQGYTTSVAEVASTLFENFVFDEIFETLSDEEKIIALHDKINDSISTIMRQVACFNFELELHSLIKENGYIPAKDIAACMNKHMQSYLGPMFKLEEQDGYFFTSWPHIRNHFYVYTYAFGELVSKALYSRYKKDKAFMKKIESFLSAGGSMSPKDIFKRIGIDISNPKFFEDGLMELEADVKQLEKLIG